GAIENMIKRVGGAVRVSTDAAAADAAEKLVVPGVGAFDNGVRNLRATGWWERILAFAASGRPVLGICLGMQLLGASSGAGEFRRVGLSPGTAVRSPFPEDRPLRPPHMGWNDLKTKRAGSPLLRGFESDVRFYFAHSYHVVCEDPSLVLAETEYGYAFAS